jgi:hypothetical protein
VTSLLAVDVWVTIGALVQCALILRARGFDYRDRVVPLAALLLIPAAWFGFITLCGSTADAAESYLIGLAFGLTISGACVISEAPPRLTATSLLSLTVTFWAVYRPQYRPDWFYAAVFMSLVAALVAVAGWNPPGLVRAAIYAWSLAAAAAIIAGGVSTKVAYALTDYHHTVPAGLNIAETLLTGAQYFLFMQLLTGLILFLPISEKEHGLKYADRLVAGYDAGARLRWTGVAVLLGQAAALYWARRAGGEIQSEFVSLATVAALAHGAMTGEDAGAAPRRSGS